MFCFFVLGNVARVEAVAHLAYFIGSVTAKEEWIVRHVEDALAVSHLLALALAKLA